MKLKNKKVEIGLIAALALLVLPYAMSILYALPSTDDFWMGIGVERSSIVIDSIQKASDMWMGWGGMWIYSGRLDIEPSILETFRRTGKTYISTS